METKHTPGPWEYNKEDASIKTPSGITAVILGSLTSENAQADAKLIRAAPEMYEAIKALLNRVKELQMNDRIKHLQNEEVNMLSVAMRAAEKAIQKATI